MPYSHRIDRDAHRAVVVASGPSSYAETHEATEALLGDPDFVPSIPILVDARKMEYLASYEDALAYRDMFDRLRPSLRGPIAIVVEGTARYGMTRMVSTFAQLVGVNVEAFRDLEGAEAWLAEQAPPA